MYHHAILTVGENQGFGKLAFLQILLECRTKETKFVMVNVTKVSEDDDSVENIISDMVGASVALALQISVLYRMFQIKNCSLSVQIVFLCINVDPLVALWFRSIFSRMPSVELLLKCLKN